MTEPNRPLDRPIDRRTLLKLGLGVLGGAALGAACQPQQPAQVPAKPAAPAPQPAPAAAPKPAAGVPSVKLALLHPLTGAIAYEGNLVSNGARLRLDEANAAGGIKSMGGARIEIMQADTQGKPEIGVAETERLAREGVVAILGAHQSAVVFAATQAAEKEKVPFIITTAVSDDITKRGFKYTFRQQPNSESMAKLTVASLAEIIQRKQNKKPGDKSIVIIHEDTLMGDTMGRYLEAAVKATGFKLLDKISYKATTSDLTTEVSRIRSAKPDILFVNGYYPDTVLMMRTIRDLRVDFEAIVGTPNPALSNPKFAKDEPKLAESMMDGNYWWNPVSERAKKVREAFKQKHGEDMPNHSIQGYQAADVLVDALERAGKADREALRDALVKTKLTGIVVPGDAIEFDERGENKHAQPLLLQFQKLVPRAVAPAKFAEADPLFPIPALQQRMR